MAKDATRSSASTTLDWDIIENGRRRFDDAQKEMERLEAEKQILLQALQKEFPHSHLAMATAELVKGF